MLAKPVPGRKAKTLPCLQVGFWRRKDGSAPCSRRDSNRNPPRYKPLCTGIPIGILTVEIAHAGCHTALRKGWLLRRPPGRLAGAHAAEQCAVAPVTAWERTKHNTKRKPAVRFPKKGCRVWHLRHVFLFCLFFGRCFAEKSKPAYALGDCTALLPV